MTAPMPPQPMMQPTPPPPQPPSPFPPRANDSEPAVAMAWMKRLSKLMFDPRYSQQDPLWRQLVDDKYTAAQRVIQSVTPLPALPKGVSVQEKVTDAAGVAQGAQAAIHGQPPAGPSPSPSPAAQPQQAPHGVAHMAGPAMPRMPA